MKLTAENVTETMEKALYGTGEVANGTVPADAIKVEGLVRSFGFDPVRLEPLKPSILAMLKELPDEFQADTGGGWSFLNACNDKYGEQWTGMQTTMEELMALGIAAGYVEYLLPRDMWDVLPGGVPYFMVKAA